MTYKTDINLNGWKLRIRLINPTTTLNSDMLYGNIEIGDFTTQCFIYLNNNLMLLEKRYSIGKYPEMNEGVKEYDTIKLPKEWKKRIMIDLGLIKI